MRWLDCCRLAAGRVEEGGEGSAEGEVASAASHELLEQLGQSILHFLKLGMSDEAAAPAIWLLVGLLKARVGSEDACAAIRTLASRGTHGDSIRSAGGIPPLFRVIREGAGLRGAEYASCALAHLVMQRSANREALLTAGGVPLLMGLLHARNQAAEYAASILGALLLCGPEPATLHPHDDPSIHPLSLLQREGGDRTRIWLPLE
ncbi:MAG: hypothetical protein SGPRY_010543 [Prymnesium sp.]